MKKTIIRLIYDKEIQNVASSHTAEAKYSSYFLRQLKSLVFINTQNIKGSPFFSQFQAS
jgi:hypothetical protein